MVMRVLKGMAETLKAIDKRLTNMEGKLNRNGLQTPDSEIAISLECLPFKNGQEFLAFDAKMKEEATIHCSLVKCYDYFIAENLIRMSL